MKNTKEEAYREFLIDLRNIENNIELNTADKSQFIKLNEFYQLAGINQNELSNLLQSTGFSDLIDFYNRREELKKNDSNKISFFISTIKGINNAVEKRLLNDLQENP